MKFTGQISDLEKEQLKKQGSIPVKWKDLIIGKAYIDEHDNYIIEIDDQYKPQLDKKKKVDRCSIGFKNE